MDVVTIDEDGPVVAAAMFRGVGSTYMGEAWSIEGEYLQACSCDFVCPCITSNATAPATEDFCKFAMTYRVDSGQFGGTRLDGVVFAVVAQSKAIMSQGDWIMGVIVDDRATAEQADAIAEIASGECLAIDNTFHPANKRLNLATAVTSLIDCFGIRWKADGKARNGHFASFAWRGAV